MTKKYNYNNINVKSEILSHLKIDNSYKIINYKIQCNDKELIKNFKVSNPRF